MKKDSEKLIPTRSYHASPRLTHEFKRKLAVKVKMCFINKDFIELIANTLKKLPAKDKIMCLHYFLKLAKQIMRAPDQEWLKANEDEYLEKMAEIQHEQEHYEPVRWIEAELTYLMNTSEHLTQDDVIQQLDIMQAAKERLSKEWLTKKEVMDLFRISKSTLDRRVVDGMPAHKNGRMVYFYLEEINDWMRKDAA